MTLAIESKGSSPVPAFSGDCKAPKILKRPTIKVPSPPVSILRIATDGMNLAADFYERVKLEGREAVQTAIDDRSPLHPSLIKLREAYSSLRSNIEVLVSNHPYRRTLRWFLRDIVTLSTAPLKHLDETMAKVRIASENILWDNNIPVTPPFEKTGIICLRKVPKGAPDNVVSKEELEDMMALYKEIEEGRAGIRIEGDAVFKAKVLDLVAAAIAYPRGYEILDAISRHSLTLPISPGNTNSVALPIEADPKKRSYRMTLNFEDNIDSTKTYRGLANGKAYACNYSEITKFIHECIHAKHFISGFQEFHTYSKQHPDFSIEEEKKWSNCEERVTIGLPGDIDPYTENTFKGNRNTFLARDGHKGIPKFPEEYTDSQILCSYIDNDLDGEIEFILATNPELFAKLSASRKASIRKREITAEMVDAELTLAVAERNIFDIVSLISRHKELFTEEMYIKVVEPGIFDPEGFIMGYILTAAEYSDRILPETALIQLGTLCSHHFPDLFPIICIRLIEKYNEEIINFDAWAYFDEVEMDFLKLFRVTATLGTEAFEDLHTEILLLSSPD